MSNFANTLFENELTILSQVEQFIDKSDSFVVEQFVACNNPDINASFSSIKITITNKRNFHFELKTCILYFTGFDTHPLEIRFIDYTTKRISQSAEQTIISGHVEFISTLAGDVSAKLKELFYKLEDNAKDTLPEIVWDFIE